MTIPYGEQPQPKPTSPEVLRRHLESTVERIAQIDLLLSTGAHLPFQTQELRSERQIHVDTKVELLRQLDPPKADAELAKAQAESLRLQAEQLRIDHAPTPPEVLEERRQAAAKRRAELLDLEEKEQTAVLMQNIERWEREGDYRSAKLYRVQLARLRRDLEERYPI
jgi:hypothetical protein